MKKMLKFITMTDGYKVGHKPMFDALGKVSTIYSNGTFRGSRIKEQEKVVFLGLQFLLQHYLMEVAEETFFSQPKKKVLDYYQRRLDGYLGPNNIGVEHIGALHDLGYIPLEFYAVPEGTHVKLKHPAFTVENTHPDFYWVTNYFETLISDVLWQPCTSATTAYRYYKIFKKYADETGGNVAGIPYQGHNFSMRGMVLPEGAALSDLGHLSVFKGSDTLPTIDLIEDYYGCLDVIAQSVAASEHSVMTLLGKEGEYYTLESLIKNQPNGFLSLVVDGFNFWKVIGEYLPKLKPSIIASNGKTIIRPDTGTPEDILCGDENHTNPFARKGLIECLWDLFGGTINSAGYKVLDSHIGSIYGDSITEERALAICARLKAKGFACTLENFVLGIGSFTYNFVTRDTHGFAIKATYGVVNDEERLIFKDPQTGDGLKKSARGRLALIEQDGDVVLVDGLNKADHLALMDKNLHKLVWRNSAFVRRYTWDDVRVNVMKG